MHLYYTSTFEASQATVSPRSYGFGDPGITRVLEPEFAENGTPDDDVADSSPSPPNVGFPKEGKEVVPSSLSCGPGSWTESGDKSGRIPPRKSDFMSRNPLFNCSKMFPGSSSFFWESEISPPAGAKTRDRDAKCDAVTALHEIKIKIPARKRTTPARKKRVLSGRARSAAIILPIMYMRIVDLLQNNILAHFPKFRLQRAHRNSPYLCQVRLHSSSPFSLEICENYHKSLFCKRSYETLSRTTPPPLLSTMSFFFIVSFSCGSAFDAPISLRNASTLSSATVSPGIL